MRDPLPALLDRALIAPGRRLLIGVGNRDRGDDAVGPIVCDLVREQQLAGVVIEVLEGSVVDLPLRWEPDDHVVIVDAAEPAGSAGHVTVVDALAEHLTAPNTISTHSIDVGAAIELSRALDRLPSGLHIVGVEAEAFEFGAPLTTSVQAAAERLAATLSRRADRPADGS